MVVGNLSLESLKDFNPSSSIIRLSLLVMWSITVLFIWALFNPVYDYKWFPFWSSVMAGVIGGVSSEEPGLAPRASCLDCAESFIDCHALSVCIIPSRLARYGSSCWISFAILWADPRWFSRSVYCSCLARDVLYFTADDWFLYLIGLNFFECEGLAFFCECDPGS